MVVIMDKFMLEELGTMLEKDAVEQDMHMLDWIGQEFNPAQQNHTWGS